jgi:replicative DNA helicase
VDVEHAVISEVVLSEDMGAAAEYRLTPSFFTDPDHQAVFELIHEFWLEHGKVPGEDVIKRAYPIYEFGEYDEPLSYYVTELRDRHLHRHMVEIFQDPLLISAMQGSGTHAGQRAFNLIMDGLINARMEVPVGKDEDLLSSARRDMMGLLEQRRLGGLRGISTGFSEMDTATGGMQEEQLWTLIGLPSSGKSSMLLRLGLTAVLSGVRILFVTFEMSNEEQRDRAVSLVAEVPLSNILSGHVSRDERMRINEGLERLSPFDGFFQSVYDRSSMTTLSGLQAKIGEYQPAAVFVDGVYMMEDETGEPPGSPRALTNITRGLKRLAQNRKIPIIISTQALQQKSRGGVNMHSAGYTSSFAQDSDVILIVEACPEPNADVSKFRADKVRSGPKTETFVRIGWDKGRIERVDPALIGLNLDGLDDVADPHDVLR